MQRFQYYCVAAIVAALFCAAPALGQTQPETAPDTRSNGQTQQDNSADGKTAKPPKPFGGGSPLDVITNTRFWQDPPQPKDFVLQNRQPVDELKFQPTVGTDPERPKVRTKDELQSLQTEMEAAAVHNSRAVKGLPDGKKKATPISTGHKTKPAKPSDKPPSADKVN